MAIKVTVSKDGGTQPGQQEKPKGPPPKFPIRLRIRKMLNGDLLIMDSEDIDIILMRAKKKILTLPKDQLTDEVYDCQDRFFKFLSKKGVIDASTVQAANIFGSIEGKIMSSDDDAEQITLFAIKKFLMSEEPYEEMREKLQREEELRLTDPDPSTEEGEVPHDPNKGNMPNPMMGMNGSGNGYFWESLDKTQGDK